jgi:hypothetical protein
MIDLISIKLAIFYSLLLWIKSFGKLLIFPTIQKPYAFHRQFYHVGYAASLKPPVFKGVNYKRWRARIVIWLTTMRCFDASKGKPRRELTLLRRKLLRKPTTS